MQHKHVRKISIRMGVLFVCLLTILGSMPYLFYAIEQGKTALTQADGKTEEEEITWVEFKPTLAAMKAALDIDIDWHQSPDAPDYGWIELLSLWSARNGGEYEAFSKEKLQQLASKIEEGATPESLTKNQKLYDYYLRAYSAALSGMVGEYTKVTVTLASDGTKQEKRETGYGLRVCSPVAAGYYYNDYDDFGASRSYGYKRSHLGHDLLGSIGTPIVAVESGYIAHIGWNQYGGWRVGIRSFDGKRYYYYAHLRAGHPYAGELCEGQIVHAGEVIGYLGMTGYSKKENTNGINIPHLHLGMQLIFKQEQIEGWNQIWLDLYALVRFWGQNSSKSVYDQQSGERVSTVYYEYPEEPD